MDEIEGRFLGEKKNRYPEWYEPIHSVDEERVCNRCMQSWIVRGIPLRLFVEPDSPPEGPIVELGCYTVTETPIEKGCDCNEKKWAKGLCKKHYYQDYEALQTHAKCRAGKCSLQVRRRGLCYIHYKEEVSKEKEEGKRRKRATDKDRNCSVTGCETKRIYNVTKMLCKKHYRIMLKNKRKRHDER